MQENLTPSTAKQILSLPSDLLSRNDGALVKAAVPKLENPASTFKGITEKTADDIAKLEKATPPVDAAAFKQNKELQSIAIAGLVETAQGKHANVKEAADAKATLVKLSENPALRNAIIEGIAKSQNSNDSSNLLPTLGQIVANQKEGFESIGAGLKPDEKSQLQSTVRDAFEKGLKSDLPTDNRNAARGMACFSGSLDDKSFELIKNNLSFETANETANYLKNFKPTQQEELRKDLIAKINSKDDASSKAHETAVLAMGTLFGQKGLADAGLEVRSTSAGNWRQPEQLIQAKDTKSGSTFLFTQPLDDRGSKHLLPSLIEREPKADRSGPVSTEFKWQLGGNPDSWMNKHYLTDSLSQVVETFEKNKSGSEGTLLRDSEYRPTDSQWLDAMQVGHTIPEAIRKDYAGKMSNLIERSDYGAAGTSHGPIQTRENLQQSPKETIFFERDSRCTDAVNTIVQVENLLKENPENKVAQDMIIALGGVSSPSNDRQKLIEANMQALSKEPDGLKVQLQAKDPSIRLQAMAKIDTALNTGPSGETLQNSLTDARLRSSSLGISPDSKPEVFDKFIEKTKADFELAAANGDRALATQLRDRYSWAGVSKLISELNNITEKDPAKASSQAAAKIEALLSQAQKGNPFAQTAVTMLVNSGDAPAQRRTQELSAKENGLALAIPNLQNLNQEAVQKLAAGLLINKVAITNGAISKAEADALSAAFTRAEAKNDLETSRLLGAAIDLALNSEPLKVQRLGKETLELNGKQAVFEAMGSALKSGLQSDALVQRYLRSATTDSKMSAQVKEDLPALLKQAEQGNQSAIKLLTGLAAFDKQNQQQATEYLKALAAKDKTRESVLKAALNSADSITGERAAGINLFKSLSGSAALSPESRQILLASLKSANANDRSEAAKALIAAASEHFKKADNGANLELALIKDNMSPEILAALLQTSGKQLLMNLSQFEKLGLSADTTNGITTIKDAKNRTEYKVGAENDKVQIREFTRFDENNKAVLTRKNVYDPRSSEFKGAEELDRDGNRSRFDANNQLKEFFKAEPSNDFVKITRGADGKATSIYDNNGRAWDSSDGGKTWTKRPSDLKAYGLPELQSDGSVKFSGKGPEGRVDVLQKADGTIEKYDDGRKESTSIKPDGSYTAKNDAGKIVKTRDSNGVEREFFWSPDNKQLTGVRDERGLWQASPDGTRWKNLSQNEDPEQEGTRSIDDNGYKVHISGEAVETSRLDGSRIETSADGQVDLINRRGERASLKYNGDDLQEVKENGNVWRRNEQNPEDKSLYLWKNGQPSDIKANFEVSKENGSIKRSLLDASKEQLDATNKPLYKVLQLNADGTMLARDDKGRIRESKGIGQERTEYQYLGDSDTLKFMLTRFPDGTAQSTGLRDEKQPEKGYIRHYHKEVSAGSPELKTIDPNKNNWEIASLSIDKTTGKIIANNVKVSVEIETGNADSPIADPRLKASSVITNVHDQIQISLSDGIQSFQRTAEGKLRLNGSLNTDRSQERLD
ncbi:MAG: hypothetical protein K2X81_19950, partial [Candidatus Obscuribacterales bacterium]|nr:hypothetical protein [Candidatus Obscuribacterales bacterium]